MTRFFIVTLCLFCFMAGAEETLLRAFPGAEGFGACTPGGRGGRVYFVTTLDDYGQGEAPLEGSLRAAVDAEGPRIVVFRVGGTIELKADLWVQKPFITIAGQTAPGGGICIKDYQFVIATNDVIVRHVRFRSGDVTRREQMAVGIFGGNNSIIDHCSMSWAIDEVMSAFGASNLTVQWSIIAEGLSHSHHPKGEHSKGSIIDGNGGITIHHSIYAHNAARNPRVNTLVLDFRNNVLYDWGYRGGYTTEGPCYMNYVGNYLKAGPSTRKSVLTTTFEPADESPRVYFEGNVLEGQEAQTTDNRLLLRVGKDRDAEALRATVAVNEPFMSPEVHTDAADVAYARVLKEAGATLPARDAADARLMEEIRMGTGRIIDSPAEVDGWPELAGGAPVEDTDDDGLPDGWEQVHEVSEGNADADGDGYTNVEEFLNATDPNVPEENCRVDAGAFLAALDGAAALSKKGKEEFATQSAGEDAEYRAHIERMKQTLAVTVMPEDVHGASTVMIDLGGKAQMELVRIPAGSFLMGSPESEGGEPNEWPQHTVNISRDYFMASTPTTGLQYWAVMGDTFGKVREGEGECSANQITWQKAVDYCEFLSAVTGYTFRLPTEAEWEYACRAGTTTAFNTGDTISTAQANFAGAEATRYNAAGPVAGKKVPVRTYPPNAWGLYHMHGDEAEYCLDSYARPYSVEEVTDPLYLEGGVKILRGGKATSNARYVRSAYRYGYAPGIGYTFRVVMEVKK